ncbi:SapB/AmfS family lanthipeptide [Nonomuraea sp. NPDC050783]
MVLLDLQGLEAPSATDVASGGSSLTVATCGSHTPSNLSVALCH